MWSVNYNRETTFGEKCQYYVCNARTCGLFWPLSAPFCASFAVLSFFFNNIIRVTFVKSRSSGGGGDSDTLVYNVAGDILEKLPKNFDTEAALRRWEDTDCVIQTIQIYQSRSFRTSLSQWIWSFLNLSRKEMKSANYLYKWLAITACNSSTEGVQ